MAFWTVILNSLLLTGVTINAAPLIMEEFRAAEYRGKYVILDFWATWCGPCREELPEMKRLYSQVQSSSTIALLGVSLDEDRDRLLQFLKKEQLSWPQINDRKAFRSPLAKTYGVRGIPHLVLLGTNGETLINDGTISAVRRTLEQRLGVPLGVPSRPRTVSTGTPKTTATARPPMSSPPTSSGAQGSIQGIIYYDEFPIRELTQTPPRLWFRNEEEGIVAPLTWSSQGSSYEVTGVPFGRYGMNVLIDANPENPPGFPGDLTAWVPNIDVHQAETPVQQDVHVRYLMHLRQPFDNGQLLPRSFKDPQPQHHSPMQFVWDALPYATHYQCRVSTHSAEDPTHELLISERVQSPQWRVKLPPSKGGQIYIFSVLAFHDRQQIGSLEIHGKDFLAWEYWFTVTE